MEMKSAVIVMITLGFLTPISGQAANSPGQSLASCADAIKEFHPEVTGRKEVVKRRSGSRGRYEYWINAGIEGDQPESRIYCRASGSEGVIALAVQSGHWASGKYPRVEDATNPTETVRLVKQPDQ
jgi:hypothetical protein